MTATSARHNTASSKAFLNNPFFRLRNVTYSYQYLESIGGVYYRSVTIILDGTDFDLFPSHDLSLNKKKQFYLRNGTAGY